MKVPETLSNILKIIGIWLVTLVGLILASTIFFVWIPNKILDSSLWNYTFKMGLLDFLGLLLILSGLFIFIWCALSFAFFGKGTLSLIFPPQKLVVRGLYRFVRNPMYIGILLVLVGEAILFNSTELFKYFLAMFGLWYFFVIFFEEPYLSRKFGKSYEQYRKYVRRWIPRFKPYREDK